MARTPSAMVPLGSVLPPFSLLNVIDGQIITDRTFAGSPVLVVMFICNHCPFVKFVQQELVRLATDYQPRGVAFVAISSNDITSHPDDGPELMKDLALTLGFPFPYLYDASQDVARAFAAACTPDFFVYDSARHLAYRGQLDDARPGSNLAPSGDDLRNAVNLLLEGKEVFPNQKPSLGCNIKWKS